MISETVSRSRYQKVKLWWEMFFHSFVRACSEIVLFRQRYVYVLIVGEEI